MLMHISIRRKNISAAGIFYYKIIFSLTGDYLDSCPLSGHESRDIKNTLLNPIFKGE